LKRVVALFLFLLSLHLHAQPVTIQAAEDIKYLSQKMANDYLFLFYKPDHFKYLPMLKKSLQQLETDLRTIAKDTQSEDIHAILDYLSYTKDEIADLLEDDISEENAQKILDFSNTLVEGVDNILESLQQRLFKYELKYNLMKLSKLYMAVHLKLEETDNTKALYDTIQTVERKTQKVDRDLYVSWHTYKRLFNPTPLYFIPHLMSIAVEDLEESVDKL